MTTQTNTQTHNGAGTTAQSTLMAALFVAVLGGAMLFIAGHAQSATLHDAAHDVRHATGFPCH